jgi:thiol-disulfide isomerase/thioredoxin
MRWARTRIQPAVLLGAFALGGALVTPAPSLAQQHAATVRPWLGVSMDPEAGGAGVLVKHVVRGSPAERAGIHEQDRILRVDRTACATSRDVTRVTSSHAVGDSIDVVVSRGGRDLTLRVVLAAFPDGDDMIRMDHVGTFAPTWHGLQAVTGTVPRSVGDLRGRVVLVDFWATWCGPCRVMTPKLSALQARYGAQGLSVVGISTEEAERVAVFAERIGMRYPVAVDTRAETTQAYTVASLPTLFVIDKRGVVRQIEVGYDSSRDAALEDLVRSLLAEPAP